MTRTRAVQHAGKKAAWAEQLTYAEGRCMELMLLLGAGTAVLFCIWLITKVSVGYAVPPEKSGLAFLKQELRKTGVDVGAIPITHSSRSLTHAFPARSWLRRLAAIRKMPPGVPISSTNCASTLNSFVPPSRLISSAAKEVLLNRFFVMRMSITY